MILSRQNLERISSGQVQLPSPDCFNLPEKVLQFGTGVLLRALPDYFIDKANKQGIFNGSIVIVKSTGGGDIGSFARQDNLYTVCVRGIGNKKKIEENIINASVSRVLSAKDHWEKILDCAANPDMQLVISNTTEVGIVLMEDDIHASPPASFPGKLLAFLYERFRAFDGDPNSGMVIVPTELLPENGKKLLSILLELAKQNGLSDTFLLWLQHNNCFCNSLVDRIVPGKFSPERQQETEAMLGYHDELMIMSEVYRLWAIEPDNEKVRRALSFSKADDAVIIAPDIRLYRELKLRILNGSHTFSCGLAHLAGFTTVKEAMQDAAFASYIQTLMMQEIAVSIIDEKLSMETAVDFVRQTLDRYRNPYLEHKWLSITLQYSSKMRMRNVPLLLNYYSRFGNVPEYMALGFAAHILFTKPVRANGSELLGEANGNEYPINDAHAAWYGKQWEHRGAVVQNILSSVDLWGADLSALPGFQHAVETQLSGMMQEGAAAMVRKMADVRRDILPLQK